ANRRASLWARCSVSLPGTDAADCADLDALAGGVKTGGAGGGENAGMSDDAGGSPAGEAATSDSGMGEAAPMVSLIAGCSSRSRGNGGGCDAGDSNRSLPDMPADVSEISRMPGSRPDVAPGSVSIYAGSGNWASAWRKLSSTWESLKETSGI